jgi:hypothetical protein
MAGMYESILSGGDGKDIMIGEKFDNYDYTAKTTFVIGTEDGWDNIADIIQNFGTGDRIDLSNLGITDSDVLSSSTDADGKDFLILNDEVVAEFSSFNNELTMSDILDDNNEHLIYG